MWLLPPPNQPRVCGAPLCPHAVPPQPGPWDNQSILPWDNRSILPWDSRSTVPWDSRSTVPRTRPQGAAETQRNNKPGTRQEPAPQINGRCGAAHPPVRVTWVTQPRAGVKTLGLAEKAFSGKERAGEGEAGSALPGPPACQPAGITELRRMSPRDDRAATLIFSAASAPVSYLCAGMIGIHYRAPPATRGLPGEESASSRQA